MKLDPREYCRVCGLRQETWPWGSSGDEPSFETCDCCGIEFGFEDCSRTGVQSARDRWKIRGYDWFQPSEQPESWSAKDQLAQIGVELED